MSSPTRTTPIPASTPVRPPGPVGRIIAASIATGAIGAAALTFGVLPDASEASLVGAALLAFAAAWAMLAWLTTRMTTRPQRWAYVPATVMAATGTVLLAVNPGEAAVTRLVWGWAPALVVLAVWVQRRARRSVHGRSRLLVYPVTLVMLMAGLGGLYQAMTSAPQEAAGPMPGRLVDVGGYRLHLNCIGTGSPVVVLLNGLGETSPEWTRITPSVAATTRTCTFDRAGQGWSDDSPHPADATTAATDLHRLLTAAGEPGPYVLAGHSIGGVHALTYTHLYPSDVAGMVLLDSASPHQAELVKPFNGEYELMRRALAAAPIVFRFGLGHLTQAMTAPALPGKAGEQAAVFANSPRGMTGMRAEQALLPQTFRQAQALTTLGATPLVVLTAKDNVDHKQGWDSAQNRLAALSSDSRHTVADLEHVAFLHDPAGSALSITAITDVVTAARTRTPVHSR
ncbi:alpha/beta fold hydrolase [Actinoplanes sp. NPDC051633]|uniref:alpha/beta fold hydrolase n=1 Tax=Actinoplanes sp. NPDC051633 TaxID=3155670 RepID=UPI0034188AAF